MKDVVSDNTDAKSPGLLAEGGTVVIERPSLFCGLDGTCVNPHAAIPLDARDTFARNFRSHFAAALGESQHSA